MTSSPVSFSHVGISISYLFRDAPMKTVALSEGSYTLARLSDHRTGPSSYEMGIPLLRKYHSQQIINASRRDKVSSPAFKNFFSRMLVVSIYYLRCHCFSKFPSFLVLKYS